MKTIILGLLGVLQGFNVTAYRSVPNQTDSTPFHTSTGEHVSPYGVAVSQDLICPLCKRLKKRCGNPPDGSKVHYGDLVLIQGVGFKFVNDLMSERHRNRFDVWVATLRDEQAFHKRFKDKKLKVWRIYEASKESKGYKNKTKR